jgi:hypothetical protein
MHWDTLVELWFAYNRLLTELVDRIPESRLNAECSVAAAAPVTLGFLIDDYILHMQHHIDQLLRRDVITQHPRAAISGA